MDKKYLKESYSSIGIKLGGCGNKGRRTRKSRKYRKKTRKINRKSRKINRKYKIIKFSSLM
jgi:hypothetical protein